MKKSNKTLIIALGCLLAILLAFVIYVRVSVGRMIHDDNQFVDARPTEHII